MSTPTSFTQYCDDIRREADGRPSLMGIYPHSAMVNLDGHKKLPKICVYTMLTLPHGHQLEKITVTSEWNDKEVERIEIPAAGIADINQKLANTTIKNPKVRLATMMEIRNLEIGEGGWLQTKVVVNESPIEQSWLHLQPHEKETELDDQS